MTNRLTCEETFRRLDDYLDRELTPAEMDLVARHLEECAMCSAEFRFEAGVLDEVRRKLRRVALPADLMARISEQLRRARDDHRPSPGGSGA